MKRFLLAAAVSVLAGLPATAADDPACKPVRMSDPGWTDITSTNAIASTLLKALGYEPDVKTLSVPIGYQAMKNGELDVFLGNWMPAQQRFIDDLTAAKAVEVVGTNLAGAKFTLAVPNYVAEAGVKDFKDLAAHAEKFGSEIYGIESGAPANQNIQKMINAGSFGLTGWKLVESGEQAMLSQVKRSEGRKKWVVFLAWAPHPMNDAFKLTYLSGGDEYFGPNYGGAEVRTLARTGWTAKCPNAAAFFKNLKFDLATENAMMGKILDQGQEAGQAARAWIKEHPDALGPWLAGVTTLDGRPGLPAVKAALGL
ncbi:choline ABC transporter substrate-binding protein [Prosthecodimorpha staleyi]|uniref:Choline ABC transporter substrate-binding protein n=1 Tax=Prosthecodimorpha staleyi TaxID=2840188 RepID=A0A947D861_9HYPH|nr:choline ABC transporter substrate-binding protein [Prosthecodimorpha staleyi]MBT9289822.1 choline ABC transporter substrate-binding protein [Prosthecodimorpha staleyi]